MKRTTWIPYIYMAGNIFLLTACHGKAEPGIAHEPTDVRVEADEVDIGEIRPGTKHDVEYKIHNSGKHTLHISNILPSCDCTTAKCDKQDAEPGEHITVTLTYKAEDFTGFVYRTAEVECNTVEPVILTLTGTIQ